MEAPEENTQEITQEDIDTLTVPTEEAAPSGGGLSFGAITQALKRAVMEGSLTPQQAAGMRRDMGITSSYFTGKKVNPSKRKRINKMAKKARKLTKRNGFKGQKMTKGKR